jgi:hypothetical protein
VRSATSVGINATVRAFAYVLLVFSLTLQQFAPLSAMAATGGHTIVLCSIGGTRTVTVDADGKAIPHEQDHKCPMCACFQSAHALAAPAIVAIDAPLPTRISTSASPHRPYTPPYLLYESTGPPRVHA